MARRGSWKAYGQSVEVEIGEVGDGGEGLGEADGCRYRVQGALPGERVRARIIGRKAGWRLAVAEEVIRAHPLRLPPRCAVFGQCGGCTWQSLEMAEQGRLLEQRVRRQLETSGARVPDAAWEPLVEAVSPWQYRGKIELSFSRQGEEVILGFNRRGNFLSVVDVPDCAIGPPVNSQLIRRVRAWANRHALPPFHPRRHEGLLRYLVIRQARPPLGSDDAEGPWIVALVTATPSAGFPLDELSADLATVSPAGSFLHVITDSHACAVKFDESRLVFGPGVLEERLGGVRYPISIQSFFQSNAEMAERLLDVVRERALAGPVSHVLDLYSGVGTLALGLAREAGHVTGVEYVPEAVADARRAAVDNGLANTSFVVGAAEMFDLDALVPPPDLVLLDPPRGGIHPRLAQRLAQDPPPRIIYVSCNPESLARDLGILGQAHDVRFARCLQMFPHTPHVETVVEMTRRSLP